MKGHISDINDAITRAKVRTELTDRSHVVIQCGDMYKVQVYRGVKQKYVYRTGQRKPSLLTPELLAEHGLEKTIEITGFTRAYVITFARRNGMPDAARKNNVARMWTAEEIAAITEYVKTHTLPEAAKKFNSTRPQMYSLCCSRGIKYKASPRGNPNIGKYGRGRTNEIFGRPAKGKVV